MNLVVTVLHNVSADMFFRYNPETSRLAHAYDFLVEADDVDQAANLVFTLANIDGPSQLTHPDRRHYGGQVLNYRNMGNRSLSVGDVLIFRDEEERAFDAVVVASVGFRHLAEMPPYEPTRETDPWARSASYLAHKLYREAGVDEQAVYEAMKSLGLQEE